MSARKSALESIRILFKMVSDFFHQTPPDKNLIYRMSNMERPPVLKPERRPDESGERKTPQGRSGLSLWDRLKEITEGVPIRKDLALRETVNIGGRELRAGDIVYTFDKKTGELVPWRIRGWGDTGVALRHRDADRMRFKEKFWGRADEWECPWDDLGRFSPEPARSKK